ncbi:MAG: PAS domain S-box protein [Acidobacteria bacterium]|nr:PAS domain S-box protein [Acidobacteriota bacterium]
MTSNDARPSRPAEHCGGTEPVIQTNADASPANTESQPPAETHPRVAESSLQDVERFRALCDFVPIGIGVVDPAGRFVAYNEAFMEPGGYSREDIKKLDTVADLYYDPRQRDEVQALFRQEGILKNHPVQFRRKDGSPYDALLTLKQTQLGGQACVQALVEDVTERRRAEKAVEEDRRLLGEAQRIGNVGGWEFDIDTKQLKWTSEFYRNQQMKVDSGRPAIGRVAFYAPAYRPAVEQAVLRAIELEQPLDMELEVTTASGKSRWVRVIGEMDRERRRVIGFFQDTTRHKRAEEEQAALEARLQQAQRMGLVGSLAGGVAHEFNNMLTVILGHTEIALDGVDQTDPLHADLVAIRTAATRSADLTRQLLAFARKQTVAPRVLDLNAVVASTLKMLERLIGENIRLQWQPGTGLWRVKVAPSQIDEVLTTLCVNARDAINGVGTITVATGNTVLDTAGANAAGVTPGEYVRLCVGDDGCGMDHETLAHIFEPFFTTKAVGMGVGLGLPSAYGAIKQNGGFIQARSEPGVGTTLEVYLPRHVATAIATRTEGVAESPQRGRETILLVEDDPSVLKLTALILRRLGYAVIEAGTPGDAVRRAMEHGDHIDLLMTDVVMPEMSGQTLAKELLSFCPHLKHLFMSGYASDVIAHGGRVEDGTRFLPKPFSIDELAAAVREILSRD